MRIAIFAESFLPKMDGVTRTVCRLLDHLAARGHQSLLFVPEGAPAQYADTTIIGLPSLSMPVYPELRLAPPASGVEPRLWAFAPDLIHLVNPALLGLNGLHLAQKWDLPLVASYHTDLPGYAERYGMGLLREPLWSYFRWLHNKADLNLCPSRFTQRQLEAHGFQRVRLWPHGVDTQRFGPQHASRAWRERLSSGQTEALLLLYVGRLAVEKRLDWLRPVLDACPEARLALVGDGPARAHLETLFAGTPTVFTGYLAGDDLAAAYASADIFVFPSASETFGNVVLEAMASRLPVIAPDAGGQSDFVTHDETGLLFAQNDVRELISAVRRLLEDAPMRESMAESAHIFAKSQTWDLVMDDLLAGYKELIREKSHKKRLDRLPRPATPRNWLPRHSHGSEMGERKDRSSVSESTRSWN